MIKQISSFQELYEFVNFDRKPISENFDIFSHQETYPSTSEMVFPHRRDFYSIIFLENQQEGKMQLNTKKFEQQKNILFFQSPEHIFSFVRGKTMKGFLIFIKPDFLLPIVEKIENKYSFFDILNQNVFHLNDKEKKEFLKFFSMILEEKNNLEVVKYLVLAFLEKTKKIQENSLQINDNENSGQKLISNFKNLVNNYFIEKKHVDFYAEKLNLTPNYLNHQIKILTGKTIKEHLTNRLLLEAKNLLKYSTIDIAEIAYLLNFSDPSYFGKYFKKQTNFTPKQFRENR
ncbi:helix-turn-helix domain-containing protein [Aureivirga sp. CE67]|uniref:helix-turn-helix domain-containing protein n=1 Tax=Aureivirga sp. CE67 TaxID=1788983 RepID=UPI0018C8E513|nr:helix-turn-helix domain-containing protein [Aureivirga sp. CE67]